MTAKPRASWWHDNWFRLLVLVISLFTSGVVGWTQLKNKVDLKVDTAVFDQFRDTVAAWRADSKRDLLEVRSTQLDILSVICIDQPRAPGCQRVRR